MVQTWISRAWKPLAVWIGDILMQSKCCRSQLTAERPRVHCHAEATTANRTSFPAAFLDGPTQSDFLNDPLVYVPDSYEDTDRTLPIQVLSNQEVSKIYLLPLRSACTLQTRFSSHRWCSLVVSMNICCVRWMQEVKILDNQNIPASLWCKQQSTIERARKGPLNVAIINSFCPYECGRNSREIKILCVYCHFS